MLVRYSIVDQWGLFTHVYIGLRSWYTVVFKVRWSQNTKALQFFHLFRHSHTVRRLAIHRWSIGKCSVASVIGVETHSLLNARTRAGELIFTLLVARHCHSEDCDDATSPVVISARRWLEYKIQSVVRATITFSAWIAHTEAAPTSSERV